MIKRVKCLRFEKEPVQLRSNTFGGVMNDGDDKYTITFDDAASALYFTRAHPQKKDTQQTRVVPLVACAWVELAEPEAPKPPVK